jgi:hypothetical protein
MTSQTFAPFGRLAGAAYVFALLALSTQASVQELWQNGFTNAGFGISYTANAAAVDTNGNLVVAGTIVNGFPQSVFVASFDAFGTKQWEYNTETNSGLWAGVFVDALSIAPNGDVIVAYRFFDEVFEAAAILKIRAGVRVWERTEPNAYFSNPDRSVRKMEVDANGESFVFAFDPTDELPGLWAPASLSKIDIDGHEVWRTRLPFIDVLTSEMPMPLALTDSGDAIVTGISADNLPGVAAAINVTSGKIRWVRRPVRTAFGIIGVAAGPKSTCVVGDHGYTIFKHGRRIASRRDDRFISDRVTITRDGGFILLSPHGGYTATLLNAAGRVKWQNSTGVNPALGLFQGNEQDFLAVGRFGNSLAFVRLNERGEQVSTEFFQASDTVEWGQRGTTALAAPDGTLRVMLNGDSYGGFSVAAYRNEQ